MSTSYSEESLRAEAGGARPAATALAVDLDHTLIRTDLLMEGIAQLLFHKPLALLAALPKLVTGGRPAFKRAVAKAAAIDAETLPLREDLIAYLDAEKRKGRALHLATASDEEAARAVAARVGLFDSVIGTGGKINLKGRAKRRALEEQFPDGFAYAGDSRADLAVWKGANSAVLVGAPSGVAATVRKRLPVELELPNVRHRFGTRFRALRPHQWAKNLLIFAPLLLAQVIWNPAASSHTIMGFVLLCLAASSSYVLNDLADLDSDRRHPTKRERPLAAGSASVGRALILAPAGLLLACVLGFLLSPGFGFALLTYVVLTMAYSMGLKKAVFFDTAVLGALYTLRIVMGAETAGVAHSQWLLTFSMFFFTALSLAKRHVEVMRLAERRTSVAAGRGYGIDDAPLTLAFGASCGTAAVLILVLYLVEDAFPAELYDHPDFLWAAPAVAALILGRIWTQAHRRKLDDDPVAFALRDPMIIGLSGLLVLAFLRASIF